MTRSKGTRSKSKLGQTGQDSPPASGRKRASDAGQDKASEVANLEKRRLAIAEELRHVEQQIYDLETKYLETSSPFGNAVRGYEGFLGGVSQANKKVTLKSEERLFSWSSVTGQAVTRN